MKKNIKKISLYIVIFILFLVNSAIIYNLRDCDTYFNYGFAYNVVMGLVPYRDFNMVLFPFANFLMALIMKIFGTKLIVYYIFNSLILTMSVYIVEKINKKAVIYIWAFLVIFPRGGYNLLSLLLFLILLWLEKNEKSDYLIGLILGLLIVTNQKMVVLTIPTLLTKDWRKIIKRISIEMIPLLGLLIYLFVTKSFSYFLDYTIFGLFDFGNKNFNKNFIFLILELVEIIFLIYLYIKKRDFLILYLLCFQILALPILDLYHIALPFIPVVCYFFVAKDKILKITNRFFIIIIICNLVFNFVVTLNNNDHYLNLDSKSNYYLTLADTGIDYINKRLTDYYYKNIEKYDNVYFIYNDMYYHKLKSKIPINKFDLTFYGNNGYHGNQKLKDKIKNMDNSLFIVNDFKFDSPFDQTNYEIINFIKDNYPKLECLSKDFCAYEIKKVN